MADVARPGRQLVGPARVLALTYGFFVLAAGARSGVQLATKFSVAPLAYLLSAAAAVIYTGGLVAFLLAERDRRRVRWARRLCVAELSGVIAIGAASILAPSAFPDATVWSDFGSGYGYVPLALPILGLAWARSTLRGAASTSALGPRRHPMRDLSGASRIDRDDLGVVAAMGLEMTKSKMP